MVVKSGLYKIHYIHVLSAVNGPHKCGICGQKFKAMLTLKVLVVD